MLFHPTDFEMARTRYEFPEGMAMVSGTATWWQCRQYALANVLPNQSNRGDKGAHLSSLSEDSVDKGFQFIEEEAGRLGSEWKRVQWITKHVSINQDSPIFSWPLALVEKSLRALQNDGVLALPVEDFYLTLADHDILEAQPVVPPQHDILEAEPVVPPQHNILESTPVVPPQEVSANVTCDLPHPSPAKSSSPPGSDMDIDDATPDPMGDLEAELEPAMDGENY